MKANQLVSALLIVLNAGASNALTMSGISEESNCPEEKYCIGTDDEKMPVGTKEIVTTETDPNTPEDIIVKYCYAGNDGKARWSQQYAEIYKEEK